MASDPDDGTGRPRARKAGGTTRPERRRRRLPRPTQSDLDWTFELLSKPVKITERNKKRTISTFEAILAAISLKAVAGNQRAIALQLKFKAFAAQTSEKKPMLEVVFADNGYTRALAQDDPNEETTNDD